MSSCPSIVRLHRSGVDGQRKLIVKDRSSRKCWNKSMGTQTENSSRCRSSSVSFYPSVSGHTCCHVLWGDAWTSRFGNLLFSAKDDVGEVFNLFLVKGAFVWLDIKHASRKAVKTCCRRLKSCSQSFGETKMSFK